MKHASWAVLLFALTTTVNTVADDTSDTTNPTTVQLELSKTLTLNPEGTISGKPLQLNDTVLINVPTTPPETNDYAFKWATALALLCVPLFYWFGRHQQRTRLDTAEQAQISLNQQVLTLKEALLESNSGARDEWQSSLHTINSQLREKSRYIDRMHDQKTSDGQQLAQMEEALRQHDERMVQLEEGHKKDLQEHTETLQQQLREQQELTQQIATDRDKLVDKFGEAESELSEIRDDNQRLKAELEASLAERGPQMDHIEQLTAEIARLGTSGDEQILQLEELAQSRDSTAQELANAQQELLDTRQALEQEKLNTREQLSAQQQQFSQTLEAEQQTLLDNAQLQIEELRDQMKGLEHSLEERDIQAKEAAQKLEQVQQSGQAALDDRDRDLEAMVARLTTLEASATELTGQHTAELAKRTESEADLKKQLAVLESRLEESAGVSAKLQKSEAELAQMQLINVETEQALNNARTELAQQALQLDDRNETVEAAKSRQDADRLELQQLTARLASVQDEIKRETERGNAEQTAREALEVTLGQQERERMVLRNNLKSLQTKHAEQAEHIARLETEAAQRNQQLHEQESENSVLESKIEAADKQNAELLLDATDSEALRLQVETLTAQLQQLDIDHKRALAELESANDHHASLRAKIENNDLLDAHIEELEAQLRQEQEQHTATDSRLNQTTSIQQQKLEQLELHNADLELKLESIKTELATKSESHEHSKKALQQSRKYRDELEENIRDLEIENRSMSESGNKARQELEIATQSLQENMEQLTARNQRIQELQSSLEAQSAQLANSNTEIDSMWNKVNVLTESMTQAETRAADSSNIDDATELQAHLEQTQAQLDTRTQSLAQEAAAREELELNVSALQEHLGRLQEELKSRAEHANTLGTQLIELSELRDQNMDQIATLEAQLEEQRDLAKTRTGNNQHNRHDTDLIAGDTPDEALRARENIIAALEKQVQQSDIKIAGLNQKLEDAEYAARADMPVEREPDQPVSAAELETLKTALVDRNRLIQSLANDVKVNKDLVRVFENDSNMLHDTEVELESQKEQNQFLAHELAKAVTENKTLKAEVEKVAKRLARHQNIGRTVSEDTRLQQLKSRLDMLETENRQHLEVIAQLRGEQENQG